MAFATRRHSVNRAWVFTGSPGWPTTLSDASYHSYGTEACVYMYLLPWSARVASYWRVKSRNIVAMRPQSYEGARRSDRSSVFRG